MKDEKALQSVLLALVKLHESVAAVSLVLNRKGIMLDSEFQEALIEAQEMMRPLREKIEKPSGEDSKIEFLKAWRGPLQ